MKNKILTVIITLISASLFAQEGSAQAFTLREAVDFALKNNHDAKNAKLDMKKAKAFNWEILTQGLPQLNGSFEYDYYFKTPIVPAFAPLVHRDRRRTNQILVIKSHTCGHEGALATRRGF